MEKINATYISHHDWYILVSTKNGKVVTIYLSHVTEVGEDMDGNVFLTLVNGHEYVFESQIGLMTVQGLRDYMRNYYKASN